MAILSVLRDFLEASGAVLPRNIAHIGAHFGEEAPVYEEMGAEKVIWVEANPDMFTRLCDTITARPASGTEHILVNALVANKDGEQRELFVAGQDGEASSILHQTERLKKKMPWVAETGQIITAPSYTIDTVIREAGIPAGELDTLILDTQGAELICLSGLDVYSNGIRYLLSEGTTSDYFEGGVLFDNLRQELDNRGFLYTFMGVDTNVAGMHFDFMFLQKPLGDEYLNEHERDIELRRQANDLAARFNRMNELEGDEMDEARSALNQSILDLINERRKELGATNAKDILSLLLEITWRSDFKDAWRALLRQSGYIETTA